MLLAKKACSDDGEPFLNGKITRVVSPSSTDSSNCSLVFILSAKNQPRLAKQIVRKIVAVIVRYRLGLLPFGAPFFAANRAPSRFSRFAKTISNASTSVSLTFCGPK